MSYNRRKVGIVGHGVEGDYAVKCDALLKSCDVAWGRIVAESAAASLESNSEYSLFAVDGLPPDAGSLVLWRRLKDFDRSDYVAHACVTVVDASEKVNNVGYTRIMLPLGTGKTTVVPFLVFKKYGGIVLVVEPTLMLACNGFITSSEPCGVLIYGDQPDSPGVYYCSAAYVAGNLSWINADKDVTVMIDECDSNDFYMRLVRGSVGAVRVVEMSGTAGVYSDDDPNAYPIVEQHFGIGCTPDAMYATIKDKAREFSERSQKVILIAPTSRMAKALAKELGGLVLCSESSPHEVLEATSVSSGIVVADPSCSRGMNLAADAIVCTEIDGDGVATWPSTPAVTQQRKRRVGRFTRGRLAIYRGSTPPLVSNRDDDLVRENAFASVVGGSLEGWNAIVDGIPVTVKLCQVLSCALRPYDALKAIVARSKPLIVKEESGVSEDVPVGPLVVSLAWMPDRAKKLFFSMYSDVVTEIARMREDTYIAPNKAWTDLCSLRKIHWPGYARERLRGGHYVFDRRSDEEAIFTWNWAVMHRRLGRNNYDVSVCREYFWEYTCARMEYLAQLTVVSVADGAYSDNGELLLPVGSGVERELLKY